MKHPSMRISLMGRVDQKKLLLLCLKYLLLVLTLIPFVVVKRIWRLIRLVTYLISSSGTGKLIGSFPLLHDIPNTLDVGYLHSIPSRDLSLSKAVQTT